MLRKYAITLLLLAALVPAQVHALGVGDIRVESALNQPLDATITLEEVRPAEMDSIRVRLASPEVFERMGLDRPFILAQLRFEVTTGAQGRPVVRVTSPDDIREPFLNFLVEFTWPRGRLVREFTVLLDPPDMMPAPAPAVTEPDTRRRPPAEPATPPRLEERRPETPTRRMPTGPGTHAIDRGETLWALAERTRAGDVSVAQQMFAIFEENPEAFQGNINRMMAGYVIRIPDRERALQLDDVRARQLVREHTEAWRTGEPTDMRVAEVGPATRDAELRLRAPGTADAAPGEDPAGWAGEEEARERIAELEDELEAERTGREMLSERLAELESELSELRNQLEIRDAELAALRADEEEAPAPVAEPEPAAAPEPAPEPDPDLVTRLTNLLTNPLVLALLLGIPVLVALGLVALRRKRAAESARAELADEGGAGAPDEAAPDETVVAGADAEAEDEAAGAAGEASDDERARTVFRVDEAEQEAAEAPAEEVPEESAGEDEDKTDTGVLSLDEGDPTSEADFHLAYGLYDQAADLMKDAVEKHPDNVDYRVKLLEVYFAWGKPNEFIESAREGKDKLIEAGKWSTVAILGRQLKEDEPLFSADEAAATGAATDVDLDLDTGGDEAGGDDDEFDLGEPDAETPAEGAAEEPAPEEAPAAEESNELEFDLGDFEYPGGESEETPDADETPGTPEAADDTQVIDDAGLDFDLDTDTGTGAESEPEPEPEPEPQGDDEIDLSALEVGDEESDSVEASFSAGDDEEFDLDAMLESDDSGSDEEAASSDDEEIDLDSLLESDDSGSDDESASSDDTSSDDEEIDLDAMLESDDSGSDEDDEVGGIDSQLDLARAFIDMGDADGAKGILDEVLEQGDEKQKREAQELLNLIESSS